MKNPTLRRRTPASQSYGRGRDQQHTAASYTVLDDDGNLIGYLLGGSAGYMEKPDYTLVDPTYREIGYWRSFRDAKQWIEEHL